MLEMPDSHSNYTEENQKKCPFYQFNQKENEGKKKKKQVGGCPMNIGLKRRNPSLGVVLD